MDRDPFAHSGEYYLAFAKHQSISHRHCQTVSEFSSNALIVEVPFANHAQVQDYLVPAAEL
jgi:hypothetical protein